MRTSVQAQSPQLSPLSVPSVSPLQDSGGSGLFLLQSIVILRLLCMLILLKNLLLFSLLNLGN